MTTKGISTVLIVLAGLIGPAARPGLAQEEGRAAVVLGHVVDAETGKPIETVEIRLVGRGEDLVRVTGGEGEFIVPRVPPGTYEVVLTHLAYGAHRDTIEVGAGELVRYEARLAMRPIELGPLTVTVARRQVPANLLGFYERMSMGRGHFITREDIEARQPGRTTHIIGDLPTVRVRMEGASSRYYVEFTRYRGCPPAVYLDRMLLNPTGADRAVIDDYVMPGEVEAVEAYDSPGELPAEFGGSRAACGVIVIWTRGGS
ncbi:MAG: carboxypeptidase-like regulatory domain-containing protein [Gemmatimonadales bacterium]|jgi:hypothetical protein